MKNIIMSLVILLPLMAFSVKPDDIVGIWLTEKNEAKVEIYKTGNEYFGKVIWLKEPNDKKGIPKKDINNPDPAKRHNNALGLLVIKNLQFKNGKWVGNIYGPKYGKEAPCSLQINGKNELHGTIKYGLVTGSRTWKRVK
jgi:uncharacterized protein (DUF2147 family)